MWHTYGFKETDKQFIKVETYAKEVITKQEDTAMVRIQKNTLLRVFFCTLNIY